MYPTFFQTVPDDRVRYAAVIECLLRFRWTFVGMIRSRDGSGETEFSELSKALSRHGICIEYAVDFPEVNENYERGVTAIERAVSRVIIVCGEFDLHYVSFLHHIKAVQENMTLLLPSSWDKVSFMHPKYFTTVNYSFIFILPKIPVPIAGSLLDIVNQSNPQNDPILEDILLILYEYPSRNQRKNILYQSLMDHPEIKLERKHGFKNKQIYQTISRHYYLYTAVYAMAHALHMMTLNGNHIQRLRNGVSGVWLHPTSIVRANSDKGFPRNAIEEISDGVLDMGDHVPLLKHILPIN